jgi:hypothetical protein
MDSNCNANEMLICPKTNELVDGEQCIAIRNLPKVQAEYFSCKICKTVTGCPSEDYCLAFEHGWESAGTLLQSTMKD